MRLPLDEGRGYELHLINIHTDLGLLGLFI